MRQRKTECDAHSIKGLAMRDVASREPIAVLVYRGALRVARILTLVIVWSSCALGKGQIV